MKDEAAAELAKCVSHPLRIRAIEILRERPISPVQLSREVGVELSICAYHLKVLKGHALVEVVDTVQRRGAVEHVYRPVNGRRWKAVRELLDVLADA